MNTAADPHDGDGEHRVRLTQAEALTNLRTVLELCAAGEVKRSGTTGRPSAATVHAIGTHLADGDFYTGEAIAGFAWPVLIRAGGLAKLAGTRLQPATKARPPRSAHRCVRGSRHYRCPASWSNIASISWMKKRNCFIPQA